MTEVVDQLDVISIAEERQEMDHPAWDDLIVCRVEVDLPTWMSTLTGGGKWEVYSEEEDENCVSFAMRESKVGSKKIEPKLAEVTLYHNGHAVVDVEGDALFDGTLTNGETECASLTYYNADSGEEIMLN